MASNTMHPDRGRGSAGFLGELFKDRTALAVLLVVLGVMTAIMLYLTSRQDAVIEDLAAENAAAVARSVESFRELYMNEVERRIAPLRNNPSAAVALAGIPSANEVVDLIQKYRSPASVVQVRSIQGAGVDEIQNTAVQTLRAAPGEGWYQTSSVGGRERLRYFSGNPDKKTAIEVSLPVEQIAAVADPGLRFWLLTLGGVVALGLIALMVLSGSSSSEMQRYVEAQEGAKRELEREVAERTKIEEDLRAQAQEVIQGVGVVSEAVSRILTSMTQVVSGATETAASVTEAATTVEEVKQTSQLSNQRATDVTMIAERAVQVSQTGEQSVQEAIEGMTLVRDQMQSIAESVLKLGDQSRAIGEIITAVSELAEQSNLLAINAAIEAAKAGEHGKGFAVVAQEVKALAEQSKQATAQVRTMLEQIQRAANVAVMVTEQGTKSAESGVKQSIEAGESIRALANSIAEAAQAVGQISASSQQQLIGMDQVATAMQDIKEGSQENVASMREIESSVQNLSEVGASLEALVSRYVVSNSSGIAA